MSETLPAAAESEARPATTGLRGQLGWVSYDMAGGPYFNFVKIFVFAPYFAASIAKNSLEGQEQWATIEGISGLGIALTSAAVGSMINVYGPRKPLMLGFSFVVIACLMLLWFAAPGSPVLPVAATLIVAAITAELSFLCHGSLLTHVAPEERIGFVSGLGFSANYLGTLIIAILWIALFSNANSPIQLDHTRAEEVRIVAPIAGLWFFLCAIPFFLLTPDEPRKGPSLTASFGLGLSQLKQTFLNARRYANIMRYLIARTIYFDGLIATFTFVGIYATGTFGWTAAKVGLFGLIIFSVIVFAAFLGGIVDDRIGSKRTVVISIAAVILSVILTLSITPHSVLFFVPLSTQASSALPGIGAFLSGMGFTTEAEQLFILCGILGGIFMGPALASSRTLLARLAPKEMMAEFFGLFTLTGKATSFLAPFAIAIVTRASGSQRIGIAAVFVFLIAGLIVLFTVKEERAVAL